MKHYLKEDVLNSKTKVPYGVKGDLVTTIALHDKCHIVETENGNRFGVDKSLLSEEFIEKNKIINKNGKVSNRSK